MTAKTLLLSKHVHTFSKTCLFNAHVHMFVKRLYRTVTFGCESLMKTHIYLYCVYLFCRKIDKSLTVI